MCTAALATYGMSFSTSSSGKVVEKNQPLCIPFFLAFTSSCILISTAYYLIIKVSILAMGKLTTRMRRFADGDDEYNDGIIVATNDDGNLSSSHDDDLESLSSSSSSCPSLSSPDAAKKMTSKKKQQQQQDAAADGDVSPWQFSEEDEEENNSSDMAKKRVVKEDEIQEMEEEEKIIITEQEEEEEEEEQIIHHSSRKKENERFTSIKVWTNVYGLAVGMFCIVYSLLLPNELSSFTFCTCLWVAATYECAVQSRAYHLLLERIRRKTTRKKKGGGSRIRGKFCLSSLAALLKATCSCSFICYSDEGRLRRMNRKKRIFMELQELHRRQRPTHTEEPNQPTPTQQPPLLLPPQMMMLHHHSHSSAMLFCLCLLLVAGMALKATGSFMSGRLWEGVMSEDGQSIHAAAILCSVMIPIIGVAAIKNMQRTKDVRSTMELSIPACSMGSLICLLLCILVVGGNISSSSSSCVNEYFWEVASRETR
jgi:hypothetical protein